MKLSLVADHLVVRDLFVDRLTKAGVAAGKELAPGGLDPTGVFNRDFSVVTLAIAELNNFPEPFSSYPTQEGILDVFGRTLCCNVGINLGSEAPDEFYDHFEGVLDFGQICNGNASKIALANTSTDCIGRTMEKCSNFLKQSAPLCLRRRRAIATEDLVAQVPLLTEPGDAMFIPLGSAIPFILRPNVDSCQLIGECYFHGLIKGDALKMNSFNIEDVTLV